MPQVQKKLKISQDESFFDDANLEQEIKRDYVSLLFDAEGIDEHLYLPYENYKSEQRMSRTMGENTVLTLSLIHI